MSSPVPTLRRSFLYVPGSNSRAIEKARSLPCDGLIFDLEDGVVPAQKEAARAALSAALKAEDYSPREVLVRINMPPEQAGADLAALALARFNGVVLPKVSNVAEVDQVAALTSHPLWLMMETPQAILNSAALAAHPRVAGLIMGTNDLANLLHAAHPADRAPLVPHLAACVLAARAAGKAVLDGIHLDLSDDEGFTQSCVQGRALGFDGKTLIHPKTIAMANAAYSPDDTEIERARKVIAAHAQAVAKGQGVTVVEGQMIEALHVQQAEDVLETARKIAERA